MSNYVTLNQLSGELGMDKSNLRKYAKKHGFQFSKTRTMESGGQIELALSSEDAELVKELRQTQGFVSTGKIIDNGNGHFYIVQLIPELQPSRIKLGFAANATSRLEAHRTSSPTAKLIRFWTCHRSWESTAIASITRVDCKRIGYEVYDCRNLTKLIERANSFFELMPSS